jgi:hypothetical protein
MEMSWYKYFNYGTILFAVIAAILLILEKLPIEWYTPVLIIMIILFILRIVVRVYLLRISKKKS